jgi:hypothetical protein
MSVPPLSQGAARRLIQQYVDHYNTVRLRSAGGFVTPADMLAGRQKENARSRFHAEPGQIGVTWAYAVNVRKGKNPPHPRHWEKLAELVGAPRGGN